MAAKPRATRVLNSAAQVLSEQKMLSIMTEESRVWGDSGTNKGGSFLEPEVELKPVTSLGTFHLPGYGRTESSRRRPVCHGGHEWKLERSLRDEMVAEQPTLQVGELADVGRTSGRVTTGGLRGCRSQSPMRMWQ